MSTSDSARPSAVVAAIDRGPSLSRLVARHGSPLLVLDCGVLRAQYRALPNALPDVRLHFAIKSLPEVSAIESLSEMGSLSRSPARGKSPCCARPASDQSA